MKFLRTLIYIFNTVVKDTGIIPFSILCRTVFPWIETWCVHKKTHSALQPDILRETRALGENATENIYFKILTKPKVRYLGFPFYVKGELCVGLKFESLNIRNLKWKVKFKH